MEHPEQEVTDLVGVECLRVWLQVKDDYFRVHQRRFEGNEPAR